MIFLSYVIIESTDCSTDHIVSVDWVLGEMDAVNFFSFSCRRSKRCSNVTFMCETLSIAIENICFDVEAVMR